MSLIIRINKSLDFQELPSAIDTEGHNVFVYWYNALSCLRLFMLNTPEVPVFLMGEFNGYIRDPG